MDRRFFATKGWVLISVTAVSSVIIAVMYDRFKTAEKNLVDYRLAISCPSEDNCRRKLEAKILESHASQVYIRGFEVRGGRTTSFSDTAYIFTISSAIGNQTIEISADPPTVGIPFDAGNVRIPPDTGPKFMKENFYDGEPVFIETWQSKIIFLYIDSMIDLPEFALQPASTPETQTTISQLPPKTYEIALPTSDHPLLLHAVAQYNFSWTVFFCALVLLILFISAFEKRRES